MDRAPVEYTPGHLAERILRSKATLEGERKQVTVLFVDVKGSQGLAGELDAEEWHGILDRFFAILTGGVHRFEGTVNQYTGDGIMALFGAPIAHEDHAQRACWTALHLRDELRRYAQELKRERGLNFLVRMGLNSGEVVVGKIGDDLRMDYTAQGHSVGLAARMESLCEPGTIYLSEHTAALVQGYMELEDLGAFEIKGSKAPVTVYELKGAGHVLSRLDVSRERGLTRFVGRSREMEALEAALERARNGDGCCVGVVAEAGMGKSRLCFEFVERCRARGIPVRTSTAVAHGRALPYHPILQLLRDQFGVSDQDSPQDARRKIAGAVLLLGEALRDTLPMLFGFLGVPDAGDPPPSDPDEFKRQLYRVVTYAMNPHANDDVVVFLCEDLHWMDPGTAEFLAGLVAALDGSKTLLLTNFRPEFQAAWMGRATYQQIGLMPLGPDEIHELLERLLGADPSLGGLAERIQTRTGGNPFFIEEVVQSLAEDGRLEGRPGAYRLNGPVASLSVPASVQSVLAARIDRLAEREKQLLQTAAVIGRSFPEPILREVAELPDADLAEALSKLREAEFVFEERLYPRRDWAFKHPLTQEVAYRSQLGERRARLHAAVARALEAAAAERLDERAALLAHHWKEAGEPVTAARWSVRAARAVTPRDVAEGYRHWQEVRDLCRQAPDDGEALALATEAAVNLVIYGPRVGLQPEALARIVDECRELTDRSGDRAALARLLSYRGLLCSISGDPEEAISDSEDAVAIADALGDPVLRAWVESQRAFVRLISGRLDEALAGLAPFLGPLDVLPPHSAVELPPGIQLNLFANRLACLWLAGHFEPARHLGEALVAAAEAADQREVLASAHYQLADVLIALGEETEALRHARQGLEIALEVKSLFAVGPSRARVAMALAACGDNEGALAAFEENIAEYGAWQSDQAGSAYESLIHAGYAQALAAEGQLDRAREMADRALALQREGALPAYAPRVFWCAAAALLRADGLEGAARVEALLDEGLAAARAMGTRCYEPALHAERAHLAALRGDADARERSLREALRIAGEMGAAGESARIRREFSL